MPALFISAVAGSVAGEAHGVAAVVEELVDGHPVAHQTAVLLQHDVRSRSSATTMQPERPDRDMDVLAGVRPAW